MIQGHFDPWHPRVLNKTEAQLDAILEAYSEDFPKKLKFERKRNIRKREDIEATSTQWADKLIGSARAALRNKVSFAISEKFSRTHPSVRQPPATSQPGPKVPHQMPRIKR